MSDEESKPVQVSVVIDRDTAEQLDGIAWSQSDATSRVTRSDVVRQAIREYLARHPGAES